MSEQQFSIGPDTPVEIAGWTGANLNVVTITTTLDDGRVVRIELHPHQARCIAKQLDHVGERQEIRIAEAEAYEKEVLEFLERHLDSPSEPG
jgi:predicted RNA methylase